MNNYPHTMNSFYQPSDQARYWQKTDELKSHPFEMDLSRIIHSAAFRRLQAKTQVIGLHAGDLHRTRLTHSLEVAQIARRMVHHLNEKYFQTSSALIDSSLVEAAALAHDLGHPPFGHRGEDALHQCMVPFGGFEANAQTFRILTRLEGENDQGMDLTRACLLSILKYPVLFDQVENRAQYQQSKQIKPPKASVYTCDQAMLDWVLQPLSDVEKDYLQVIHRKPGAHGHTANQTLECSIIELADDIAYGTHDVEDAMNLGMIQLAQLKEILAAETYTSYPLIQRAKEGLVKLDVQNDQMKYRLKKIFAELNAALVAGVEVVENPDFITSERLTYRARLPQDLATLVTQLHQFVAEQVIDSQRVQTVAWKGSYMVQQLFEALMNEEKLLPKNDLSKIQEQTSDQARARIVCDYIAGMTDSYAQKMYARLFGQSRSFFDM